MPQQLVYKADRKQKARKKEAIRKCIKAHCVLQPWKKRCIQRYTLHLQELQKQKEKKLAEQEKRKDSSQDASSSEQTKMPTEPDGPTIEELKEQLQQLTSKKHEQFVHLKQIIRVARNSPISGTSRPGFVSTPRRPVPPPPTFPPPGTR